MANGQRLLYEVECFPFGNLLIFLLGSSTPAHDKLNAVPFARLRPHSSSAAGAFVEELARIRGHTLAFAITLQCPGKLPPTPRPGKLRHGRHVSVGYPLCA